MSQLHVVFRIAATEYALAADQVLQLESYTGATAVPGTLPHVAGIVQVRGRVVPVIDLRLLFNEPPLELGLDARVVVAAQGDRCVALAVDSSRDVVSIDPAQIQPAPEVISEQSNGFVRGIAQVGPRLILLLDLAKVVGERQHDESANALDDKLPGLRALPS